MATPLNWQGTNGGPGGEFRGQAPSWNEPSVPTERESPPEMSRVSGQPTTYEVVGPSAPDLTIRGVVGAAGGASHNPIGVSNRRRQRDEVEVSVVAAKQDSGRMLRTRAFLLQLVLVSVIMVLSSLGGLFLAKLGEAELPTESGGDDAASNGMN